MRLPFRVLAAALLFASANQAVTLSELTASVPEPERLSYKTGLSLFVFRPSEQGPRPAVVWIHGGGWTGGKPDLFFPHARYTALRGAVGIAINYRLVREGGPTMADSFEDCKSALRYIRAHAAELGVDPRRIAVAGDSAGGQLAAALGTISDVLPNAMILFNPIVDLTEGNWSARASGKARELSPPFHVRKGLPPTILLHGLDDTVVSPDQARRFAKAMQDVGNRCDLKLVPGAKHAFVIPNYTAPEPLVVQAIRDTDAFLVSLGYFRGPATLSLPKNPH